MTQRVKVNTLESNEDMVLWGKNIYIYFLNPRNQRRAKCELWSWKNIRIKLEQLIGWAQQYGGVLQKFICMIPFIWQSPKDKTLGTGNRAAAHHQGWGWGTGQADVGAAPGRRPRWRSDSPTRVLKAQHCTSTHGLSVTLTEKFKLNKTQRTRREVQVKEKRYSRTSVFKEQEERKLKAEEEARTKTKKKRMQSHKAGLRERRWHLPGLWIGTVHCCGLCCEALWVVEGREERGQFAWVAGPSAAQVWAREDSQKTLVCHWEFLLSETKMTTPNIYWKLARCCNSLFSNFELYLVC